MKSLKFVLIAVFFAATAMNDANAGNPKTPAASYIVHLSLMEATGITPTEYIPIKS